MRQEINQPNAQISKHKNKSIVNIYKNIIKRNKLLSKHHIKTSLKYHNEHRIK